jgi:AmpD protein
VQAIVAYANASNGNDEGAQLQVDLTSGLLRGVRYVASPNCDARPEGVETDLIVVHGISLPPGDFGGPWIDRLFTNSLPLDEHPFFAEIEGLRVSSHLVIARDARLTQYVRFTDRAWHAGISSYQGRAGCNDFSVGIELEGVDDLPYENVQYQALGEVVAALVRAYPQLSADRMAGHNDVAPGRKTDPGPAFDWSRTRKEIASACSKTPNR